LPQKEACKFLVKKVEKVKNSFVKSSIKGKWVAVQRTPSQHSTGCVELLSSSSSSPVFPN
jgi:hypothetical protein